MTDNITPEERLLRLIRQKTKRQDKASSLQDIQPKIATSAAYKFPIRLDKIRNLSQRLFKFFSFRRINVALIILIILSIGYSLLELLTPERSLDQKELILSKREDDVDKEPITVSSLKPYSYYFQQINKRDIFNADFLSSTSTDPLLENSFNSLTLVGIVLDEIPQAIIEDKKDKKSYFLNKGDYVGEVKIEDILEGKVIISYEDEEFELVP